MTRRTQLPDKLFFKIRQYSRKDVELAMLIRQLLHDEGYTIPGARKRIRDLGRHQRSSPPEPRAQREVALRAELLGLRQQLSELLDQLAEAQSHPAEAPPVQVTVHQVVPVTASPGPEA
jgi:DNA-binding transcriptional MerR regulator